MNFAITMEAGAFIAQLRYEGALPGIEKNQGGLLRADENEGSDYSDVHPLAGTFHVTIEGSSGRSELHYTAVRLTADSSWELNRAWQTDEAGRLLSECSPNRLKDPMSPILTRHAEAFLLHKRLKKELPGLKVDVNDCQVGSMPNDEVTIRPNGTSQSVFALYPAFRNFFFNVPGIKGSLRFTVMKPSKNEDWRFERAWRVDVLGKTIEEYNVVSTT